MVPNQHSRKPDEVRGKEELLTLATDFIDQYYTSIKRQENNLNLMYHIKHLSSLQKYIYSRIDQNKLFVFYIVLFFELQKDGYIFRFYIKKKLYIIYLKSKTVPER